MKTSHFHTKISSSHQVLHSTAGQRPPLSSAPSLSCSWTFQSSRHLFFNLRLLPWLSLGFISVKIRPIDRDLCGKHRAQFHFSLAVLTPTSIIPGKCMSNIIQSQSHFISIQALLYKHLLISIKGLLLVRKKL